MTNEEIARLKEAVEYTINVGGDEIGIHPREIVGVIKKLQEAAARIEQLEAENARLRRALLACEPFVHHFKGGWSGHTPGDISTSELLATISAALAGKAGT